MLLFLEAITQNALIYSRNLGAKNIKIRIGEWTQRPSYKHHVI